VLDKPVTETSQVLSSWEVLLSPFVKYHPLKQMISRPSDQVRRIAMALMTEEDYIQSLRAMKKRVFILGQEVDHPLVRPSLNVCAIRG
jgi:hypothetical protein